MDCLLSFCIEICAEAQDDCPCVVKFVPNRRNLHRHSPINKRKKSTQTHLEDWHFKQMFSHSQVICIPSADIQSILLSNRRRFKEKILPKRETPLFSAPAPVTLMSVDARWQMMSLSWVENGKRRIFGRFLMWFLNWKIKKRNKDRRTEGEVIPVLEIVN